MKTLFISLLLSVVFAGCIGIYLDVETVKGKGYRITESRATSAISSIESNIAANINILKGSVPSLSIRAQGNLLPYIRTNVANGRLVISGEGYSLRTDSLIAINVYVSDIEEFTLSGAGMVQSELPVKIINISGAGDISCTGESDRVEASLTGTGNINLLNMKVKSGVVHVSGAGNIRVNATEQLDISISGIGNVYYMGNPSIHEKINGLGRVMKLN